LGVLFVIITIKEFLTLNYWLSDVTTFSCIKACVALHCSHVLVGLALVGAKKCLDLLTLVTFSTTFNISNLVSNHVVYYNINSTFGVLFNIGYMLVIIFVFEVVFGIIIILNFNVDSLGLASTYYANVFNMLDMNYMFFFRSGHAFGASFCHCFLMLHIFKYMLFSYDFSSFSFFSYCYYD
jgi:hypothetical protein